MRIHVQQRNQLPAFIHNSGHQTFILTLERLPQRHTRAIQRTHETLRGFTYYQDTQTQQHSPLQGYLWQHKDLWFNEKFGKQTVRANNQGNLAPESTQSRISSKPSFCTTTLS